MILHPTTNKRTKNQNYRCKTSPRPLVKSGLGPTQTEPRFVSSLVRKHFLDQMQEVTAGIITGNWERGKWAVGEEEINFFIKISSNDILNSQQFTKVRDSIGKGGASTDEKDKCLFLMFHGTVATWKLEVGQSHLAAWRGVKHTFSANANGYFKKSLPTWTFVQHSHCFGRVVLVPYLLMIKLWTPYLCSILYFPGELSGSTGTPPLYLQTVSGQSSVHMTLWMC